MKINNHYSERLLVEGLFPLFVLKSINKFNVRRSINVIKEVIDHYSERPVANGLTPHFAFGKQRADSYTSGNNKH